MIASRD